MRTGYVRAAAGVAALITATLLAACGSGASTAGGAASKAPGSRPATGTATFNATDVAFAGGVLRMEGQARALAALVPGHTRAVTLRRYAVHAAGDHGDDRQMRELMGDWHRSAPAPYTPGATLPPGMGPGMMDNRDWAEVTRQHGHDFNDHWRTAMIANRAAEIALCRRELSSGASPRARALARSMLRLRLADLAQLHGWRHGHEHPADHN